MPICYCVRYLLHAINLRLVRRLTLDTRFKVTETITLTGFFNIEIQVE